MNRKRSRPPGRSFGFHASNYAWAEIVTAVIGLMSFPILTRFLSVADYGTMNLVASVLAVTVAIGKLGMQHAALRGWAEVRAGNSVHTETAFEATVLWGMAGAGLAVTLIWAAATQLIPDAWWGAPNVSSIMLLAAPLIALRVLDSGLTNLLRAQESSAALAFYNSLRRVVLFLLVVAMLWAFSAGLTGFFVAMLVGELLAGCALLAWMFRSRAFPTPTLASRSLWASLAVFGLPMLGSELATVVLTMSDRFVVQGVLGTQSLGIYAAAFNMCEQLRGALLGAMVGAAYPRCMALWESEGAEGLRQFLHSFMNYYAAVAMFMIALMVAAGGDLMVVLASEKYAEGGAVAGWIMAALAIQTVGSVAAVGIFIAKRTFLAMGLLLVGGLLSIAANLLVVPWAGLRGAGWVVFGTSVVLCAMQLFAAKRFAPVVVPWRALLQFGLLGAISLALATALAGSAGWLQLLLRCAVLTLTYVAGVAALDLSIRHRLKGLVRRFILR